MCGLVGVMSSNMMNKHKELLSSLLYLDTFRGRDSTGVAAVRHNADTDVLKSTIPGYEFTEGNKLFEHLKLNDFLWIGHNRFGTVGKNIKSNAHPFSIMDDDGCCVLVGAHNGTLKNKWSLDDHATFGTDSEALYSQIAFKGLEETIALVEGAWALTYYDHLAEELRFLRNDERLLFYAYEEDKKTIMWASEMWMLRVSCSRFGIKLFEDKVFQVLPDTLYRVPAPNKTNEVLAVHMKGGVVGKKAPDFFLGGTRQGTAGGAASPNPQTAETKTQSAIEYQPKSGTQKPNGGKNQTPKKESSSGGQSGLRPEGKLLMAQSVKDKVVNINSAKHFKGFGGVALSRNELENQLANGCGWCELEFISINDKFAWLAPDKPICSKCLTGEHEDRDMIDAMYGNHTIPKTSIN